MKGMLKYKGYVGSVNYSALDNLLYGKVEFIRDLIDYQGKDVDNLKKAFEESIDDYLDSCKHLKKEPDKPFKGSFNVRVGESLHRKACQYAVDNKINLNELVIKATTSYLASHNDLTRNIYINLNKVTEKDTSYIFGKKPSLLKILGSQDTSNESVHFGRC